MSKITNYLHDLFMRVRVKIEERTKKQSKEPSKPPKITYGEPDDKGYVRVYVNDKPSKVSLLTFTPEQVKKLQDIADELHKENKD